MGFFLDFFFFFNTKNKRLNSFGCQGEREREENPTEKRCTKPALRHALCNKATGRRREGAAGTPSTAARHGSTARQHGSTALHRTAHPPRLNGDGERRPSRPRISPCLRRDSGDGDIPAHPVAKVTSKGGWPHPRAANGPVTTAPLWALCQSKDGRIRQRDPRDGRAGAAGPRKRRQQLQPRRKPSPFFNLFIY